MNAMPPDRSVPWRRLARRMAGPARGDAAVADRVAPPAARRAVLAAGLAGARLRRRSRPRSCMFGGWMDAYVDAAFRMQAACTAPTRTIVGNWVHGLPASATPGPNVDELHELVRFFDRWLKGMDNGADREPPVVWFEREYAEPGAVPGAPARPLARRDGLPASVGDARGRGGSTAVRCRSSAGCVAEDAARQTAAAERRPPAPTASTGSAITRPSAPGRPCRGAPAGRRTASPATSDPMRRSGRPGPPIRWSTRSRSSASRRSSSTSRCRRRWRPPSSG